jgi:hypothetical protein
MLKAILIVLGRRSKGSVHSSNFSYSLLKLRLAFAKSCAFSFRSRTIKFLFVLLYSAYSVSEGKPLSIRAGIMTLTRPLTM